jgi:hypothetical protein
MIDFQTGQDFLIAVPRAYREQEVIDLTDTHGLKGRIVEAISHLDYLEVWAFRGFPSEGVSAMRPRFYYRCKLIERLAASVAPILEMPLRESEETAL